MISHTVLWRLLHRDCEFRVGSGVRLPTTLFTRQKSLRKQTESLQRGERRMCAQFAAKRRLALRSATGKKEARPLPRWHGSSTPKSGTWVRGVFACRAAAPRQRLPSGRVTVRMCGPSRPSCNWSAACLSWRVERGGCKTGFWPLFILPVRNPTKVITWVERQARREE
jgi:hypothetical protein